MAIEWPFGDENIARADAVETVMRAVMAKHAVTMMGPATMRPGANQFVYLFVKSTTHKAGEPVVASVRATTARERFVHDSHVDFVLTVSWPLWSDLTEEQQESVMLHEWCHTEMLEEEPGTLPHDVQEFSAVIEHYGLWDKRQEVMGLVMQPHLPGIEGEDEYDAAADYEQKLAEMPDPFIPVQDAAQGLQDLADETGASITITHGASGKTATIKGKAQEQQAAGA